MAKKKEGDEIKTLPPDHPERLAAYDAESIVMLNASARRCESKKVAYLEAAEEAKEAKKAKEEAEADHFALLDNRREFRGKPVQGKLFPEKDPHAAEKLHESPDKDKTPDEYAKGKTVEAKFEEFKAVRLEELVKHCGLTEAVLKLLHDAGLHTIGQIAEYSKPDPVSGWNRKLVDIKGFGPAKQKIWEDAHEKFWDLWNKGKWQAAAGTSGTDGAADKPTPSDGGDGKGDQPRDSKPLAICDKPTEPAGESDGKPAAGDDDHGFNDKPRKNANGKKPKGGKPKKK